MKKLGFILLMASLFVCAFAITVSAAEIPEWTEITELEGMTDKAAFGADGTKGATSRVLMSDGKTYPAYYIFKDSTTQAIDFTEINKKGVTYAAANVVRLEIPNGITTVKQLSTSYSKLVSVVVPEGVEAIVDKFLCDLATVVSVSLPSTVKSIGTQSFYKIGAVESFVIPEGCESIGRIAFKLSQIEGVVIPSTITSEGMSTEIFYECKNLKTVVCKAPVISKQMFKYCSALENLTLENTVVIGEQGFHSCGPVKSVDIPSTCTTIGLYAFKSSQILSITVPASVTTIEKEAVMNCTNLKEIHHHAPTSGSYMYRDCTGVELLDLEGLVTAETYSFYGLTSLKTINLPETLTTVGNYSFSKLGVETLVTPASLVNVGTGAFYSSSTLKCVIVLGTTMTDGMFSGCSNLYDVVITSRLTTFTGNPFNSSPQNSYTIYYAGNDYEAVREVTKGNMRFNGKLCAYEDFDRADYGTQNVFVYGVDICARYFDGHIEDGNTCVINCTRCAISGVAEENPVHCETVTMLYNGFDKAGEKAVVCTNAGCQYKMAEEAPALFTYLGYSAPEFTNGAITLGYVINSLAIKDYERITGKSISYGVFAVGESKLGDGDVLSEDGEIAQGVLGMKVSDRGFDAFELKITGFETEAQKEAKIIFGAYVVAENEDGKEFSFMQMGEPYDGAKYYSASYNEIVK